MDGLRRTAVRSRFSSCAATRPREGAAAGPCDVCGPGEGRGDEYCIATALHVVRGVAWVRPPTLGARETETGGRRHVGGPRSPHAGS